MPCTPRDELLSRAAALQRRLAAQDVDAALILQNADMLYFTGSVQSGVCIIPASGPPVYAVRRVLERAAGESSLDRIVPLENLRALPSLLSEAAGGPVRRVGMELDVVPVAVRDRFAGVLPDVEVVDASPAIRTVRSVKSEYELGKMREAAHLADLMVMTALRSLREGMTELELAAAVEAAARRDGHQGIIRIRGWNQEVYFGLILSGESAAVPSFPDFPLGGMGPTPAVPYGAGRRRIAAGEPVIVDYTAGVDGYLCDQTRTLVLGALPEKLARAHEAALEILHRVEDGLRPGARPADLYLGAVAHAASLGYAEGFMGSGPYRARFIGHGVGVELDEWPVLAEGFSDPLESGHVVCVEPKIVFPGEGAVGIEDMFAITPRGAARLTLTDQRLLSALSAR